MQKFLVCLCILLLEVAAISGLPFPYNTDAYRLRRSPHRAVMVSGYYGRPSLRRSEYEPEGAMTAFVSGETVATNSYLGSRYPLEESEELDAPIEENVQKGVQQQVPDKHPQPEVAESSGEESLEEAVPSKPKRIPKRKSQKPQQEEEDEDDEGAWPFQSGRRVPSYTAFFPTFLGGSQGGKTRGSEGGYPGSATAIANSFSTGKGGVASSHATAYGDPYVSTLLRNGFNGRKKPAAQREEY